MTRLSVQILPQDRDFLEVFESRPGCKWVYMDFTSIEPKILANFSRDKTCMQLFGPDSKLNDIYLFVLSHLSFGKPILKYYNPNNPTAESISYCKKHFKILRQIAKVLHLSLGYGAGAKRVYDTLKMQGVEVTFNEIKQAVIRYWRLFKGVKRFEEFLKHMYYQNGGFIYNAWGRPMAVSLFKEKDILNRFVQSSAHDALVFYVRLLKEEIRKAGIQAMPIFCDTHDSTTWECGEKDVSKLVECFRESVIRLNDNLKLDVRLDGEIKIINNLGETL